MVLLCMYFLPPSSAHNGFTEIKKTPKCEKHIEWSRQHLRTPKFKAKPNAQLIALHRNFTRTRKLRKITVLIFLLNVMQSKNKYWKHIYTQEHFDLSHTDTRFASSDTRFFTLCPIPGAHPLLFWLQPSSIAPHKDTGHQQYAGVPVSK